MDEKEASNGKAEAEGHQEHAEVNQLVVLVKEVEEEAEVIKAEEPEPEPEPDTVVDDDYIVENGVGEAESIQLSDEKVEAASEVTAPTTTLAEEELSEIVTEAAAAAQEEELVTSEFKEKADDGTPLELVVETLPPPSDEAVTVSSRDVEALPDAEEIKDGVQLEDKSAALVDQSVKESSSVTGVGSSDDAVPDQSTSITTPIISLSQRTWQTTSWRSCCGLFDVLRRSDR